MNSDFLRMVLSDDLFFFIYVLFFNLFSDVSDEEAHVFLVKKEAKTD